MSAASQGASGSAGNSRRTNTPPTRISPQPSNTPPATTPTSRPSSAPKAQKQSSSGQLSSKAMSSAKSFESAKSSRGSRDSLIARAPKTPEVLPLPNPKEELLKTLQSQFESLRSIVTCKICYGLLYEPYMTTCGHTYCYVCFCKSFQPNQIPSCPECRGRLPNPPAPAYAVREMTHAFLARPELLPSGESIEQHKQWQKEHADIVQADKDNKNPRDGGLWRGFFIRRFPRRLPIRDWEDGVDRCPFCTWELEDGMCNRCGLPLDENGNGDWEFSDIASEHPSIMAGHDIVIQDEYDPEDDFIDDDEADWQDYDGEPVYDDDEMGWEQPFTIQRMLGARMHNGPPPVRRLASHSAAGSRSRYSASVHDSEMGTLEEEDEDEDEDSSMSGFINDDEEEVGGFTRGRTYPSESQSSRFPESIAEDDEEEEDELPVAPGRRRTQLTQSSTPTLTAASQRPTQQRSQLPPSQAPRRRRVISDTPSTESTSSAAAEEDPAPVSHASRRRRRGLSQEEPVRRVRPRPQGNSIPTNEEGDPWGGYRPIGTPQIGDVEDEQSDGGRTAVGWEPITHPIERSRNTGSLTPTADRPTTPARPASRTSSVRFPLGSRGIRRRSSVVSIVHYEDNDADDDVSDTQQQNNNRAALQRQSSRARLQNTTPQPVPSTSLAPTHIVDGDGTDSGDTETSPQSTLRGQTSRRRREYDPYISMVFAQHQTEVQSTDPEGPVYAEFEHLRGIARTPVARPRTANRNRLSAAAQSPAQNAVMSNPGSASRNPQHLYSPSRFRGVPDVAQPAVNAAISNARSLGDRPPNSPRASFSGPSQTTGASRFRGAIDVNGSRHGMPPQQSASSILHPTIDQRVQTSNVAFLRAMNSPNSMATTFATPPTRMQTQPNVIYQSPRIAQVSELIDRPTSRVSTRNGNTINRPPSVVNRPQSGINRPPSAGSRQGSLTRSPFAPPQVGPAGVGLNTARTWHPNNPFFHAVRSRPSSQRLRHEPSAQTLRARPSVRVMRNQLPQGEAPEPDQDSPQMRPQASRIHLRPQPSYRRLHVQRDVNMAQYEQPNVPSVPRYSPGGTPTLSEDERVRRATELVRRRAQELAQQQSSSPAQAARQMQVAAAAQQRVEQRLASTIGRASERQPVRTAQPMQSPTSMLTTGMYQVAAVGQPRTSRTVPGQSAPGFAPAPAIVSAQHNSVQQRPPIESAPSRSTVPAMGARAITTGGDSRRN